MYEYSKEPKRRHSSAVVKGVSLNGHSAGDMLRVWQGILEGLFGKAGCRVDGAG